MSELLSLFVFSGELWRNSASNGATLRENGGLNTTNRSDGFNQPASGDFMECMEWEVPWLFNGLIFSHVDDLMRIYPDDSLFSEYQNISR